MKHPGKSIKNLVYYSQDCLFMDSVRYLVYDSVRGSVYFSSYSSIRVPIYDLVSIPIRMSIKRALQ